MDKLLNDFSFGLFFWQILLFVLLLWLLTKFAWKPILKAVNDREEGIKDALLQADKAREEMAELKASNEKILKEARQERETLLKEAREIKDKLITEAKDEAKVQADKLIEMAKTSIENEKMAAITDLKNQVAELSVEIAEKILKEKLSKDDVQLDLINKMLDETQIK
jgi:F-type H+-transporting ATPase subunit b